MMNCEICNTLKTKVTASESLAKFGLRQATVYNCECPLYMQDEIVYIRKKNIKFDIDDREKFVSLIRQKKDFAMLNKIHSDMFNGSFHRLKTFDPENKDSKGKYKYSESEREIIKETRRLNNATWHIIKNKE